MVSWTATTLMWAYIASSGAGHPCDLQPFLRLGQMDFASGDAVQLRASLLERLDRDLQSAADNAFEPPPKLVQCVPRPGSLADNITHWTAFAAAGLDLSPMAYLAKLGRLQAAVVGEATADAKHTGLDDTMNMKDQVQPDSSYAKAVESASTANSVGEAGLQRYAAWHKEQIKRLRAGAQDVLVAVWQDRGSTGFGNQVEGLISALFFAMASGRVLLIDWGDSNDDTAGLQHLQPLPLDCLAQNFHKELARLASPAYVAMLQARRRFYDAPDGGEGWVAVKDPGIEWLCADFAELYPHAVVHLWLNIYSGSLLFYGTPPANGSKLPATLLPPSAGETAVGNQMSSYFGPRSLANNPFALATRWLLRPKTEIVSSVADFQARELGDGPYVAAQMRTKESYCEGPEANATCIPIFWSCIDEELDALVAASGNKNTRLYIATDNAKVQEMARVRFGERAVWRRQVPIKRSIRADTENRLAELMLIGGASKIIATCGSSYGRLAYAWADKVPRFVTFKSGLWSSRHTPGQCREALTAKPCAPRYQRALIGDSRHPQGSKATRCLTNDVAGLRAASQEAADECDVS